MMMMMMMMMRQRIFLVVELSSITETKGKHYIKKVQAEKKANK
jgi:hypothetical protein